MHLALLSRHATWSLLLSLAVACGDDDATGTDGGVDASADSEVSEDSDVPDSDRDAGQSNFAEGPSRGASIAASEDGLILAAANAATDDVTFFDREALTERARVSVGNEPTTVVFHPAGDRAYVVNRGAGTVSEIQGADTDSPSVGSTFDLGGELVNAALSPGGSTLYVADWTGGRLHVVNTASGDATEVAIGGAPYAVCVTNDGDEEEDDETVYVTDFYSRPVDGTREAEDGSRQGRVFRLDAAGALQGEITLSPIDVTGVEEAIDAANTSAFPNQLYGCAISDTHLHITSVGASPAPFNNGTDFRQNVHGLMHAVALDTNAEVPERTVNLSQLVAALDAPKRFVGVPASVAFVPGTEFAYIASMNSNSVLRVSFETLPAVAVSPSGASFLEAG
ncbi:MAG: YncE family protein, partial [Myxococcota bacterium]